MSNKKRDEQRAIEASATYTDRNIEPVKRRSGWSSDYDRELTTWFNRGYEGECGLQSTFGNQLSKAKEGLGYKGGDGSPMMFMAKDEYGPALWCRDDLPPPCVRIGPRPIEVRVVHAALSLTEGRSAGAVAHLRAFYEPVAPGELWGLLGIAQHARLAMLSGPIRKAAAAAVVDAADEALRVATGEAEPVDPERLSMLEARLETLDDERQAQIDFETERMRAMSLEPDLTAIDDAWREVRRRVRVAIKLASRPPEHRPVSPQGLEALERMRTRRVTVDDAAAVLRRAVHLGKHGKNAEEKRAAQELVADAVRLGKASLRTAQEAYAGSRAEARWQWKALPIQRRQSRVQAFARSLEVD